MEIVNNKTENFVTVVSVGAEPPQRREIIDESVDLNSSGYITVLTIGDQTSVRAPESDIVEEVFVYRLPGERLGFGLKFEGGTKANEFVKRLFIQSCAPDSPASRVTSSWGSLSESDEVLEIDAMPVNAMTRIDCVRCLKDSSVVIKLLVRHPCHELQVGLSRSVEDLPQVVSAEKKRAPPPPPPVPPRKIARKGLKQELTSVRVCAEAPAKRYQSPRSSGRSSRSPDASRRFPEAPPDAEVYVDLFSQESMQNLSESDETGSSISTVVDRFASFPTTRSSSLAGSLPSTPTFVQKQLDLTNLVYDDDELPPAPLTRCSELKTPKICISKLNEDGTPLQPPSCFQDAPLSYGNEDMMRIVEPNSSELVSNRENVDFGDKMRKKPPVPPRSRELINASVKKEFEEIHDENMNISNLPRLVDFLPKMGKKYDNPVETIEVFLENERKDTDYYKTDYYQEIDETNLNVYNNDLDLYNSKWSLSSQLATIGEDEEEGNNDINSRHNTTPIVIVEHVDETEIIDQVDGNPQIKQELKSIPNKEINGRMDTLPSDSRQPPDGHESPDFIEAKLQSNFSDHKLNDKPSVNSSRIRGSFNDLTTMSNHHQTSLINNKLNSVSAIDLSAQNADLYNTKLAYPSDNKSLYQSLSSLNHNSDKKDRLTLLSEQRKQNYSKLKGLVIPEHDTDANLASVVNIPEIISHTPTAFVIETKTNIVNNNKHTNNTREPIALPLTSPPWTSSTSAFPKYSPAFKRKSLQVYPVKVIETKPPQPLALNLNSATVKSKQLDNEEQLSSIDAPKSLESITSPTRSDCSFDYITNSCNKLKKQETKIFLTKESSIEQKLKDAGKSEDESDNDSAVSSSQSSYISRSSPPPWRDLNDYEITSKTKPDDLSDRFSNFYNRTQKLSGVEATNRKNILASAKCRSGKDFKVGSPIVQRKLNEEYVGDQQETEEEVNESTVSGGTDGDQTITSNIEENNSYQEDTQKETKENSYCEDAVFEVPTQQVEQRATPPQTEVVSLPKEVKSVEKPIALVRLKSLSTNNLSTKIQTKTEYVRTSTLMNTNNKRMSVTDIRKNFEKSSSSSETRSFLPLPQNSHVGIKQPKKNQEPITSRRHSVVIQKIDEKAKPNQMVKQQKSKTEDVARVETKKLDRAKTSTISVSQRMVVLNPEILGTSIGITLAGGTDYETKEITVHRIRYGSVAYNDGQLKKGDRVISINGKEITGLTHAESAELLKESVSEFVIVVEDGVKTTKQAVAPTKQETVELKSAKITPLVEKKASHVVTLAKDGSGLGFSIDGGKDSLQGDLPLRIKKIFQGGIADKCRLLFIGDELLAIDNVSLINLSKIEAWNLMKKLPTGNVTISIHR